MHPGFWELYNGNYALKNTAATLNEMKETTLLNGVWKNLCPQFTHSSKHLEDPEGNVT
jgi:hypothetical protein